MDKLFFYFREKTSFNIISLLEEKVSPKQQILEYFNIFLDSIYLDIRFPYNPSTPLLQHRYNQG